MSPWPVGAVVLPAAGGMLAVMLAVVFTAVQRRIVCTLGFPSQPALPSLGSSACVFQNPGIPNQRVCPLMGSSATHPLQAPVGTSMKLPMFDTVLKAAAKSWFGTWLLVAFCKGTGSNGQ